MRRNAKLFRKALDLSNLGLLIFFFFRRDNAKLSKKRSAEPLTGASPFKSETADRFHYRIYIDIYRIDTHEQPMTKYDKK